MERGVKIKLMTRVRITTFPECFFLGVMQLDVTSYKHTLFCTNESIGSRICPNERTGPSKPRAWSGIEAAVRAGMGEDQI